MLDWSRCDAVERDPSKLEGTWIFKGTRVPVQALFENIEDGASVDQFLEWTGLSIAQPCAPGPAADALARRGRGPFQVLYRTRSMAAAARWIQDHGLPPPARGIRNTGELAMLVPPAHACGAYIGLAGPE